jgi:hypothetical protein
MSDVQYILRADKLIEIDMIQYCGILVHFHMAREIIKCLTLLLDIIMKVATIVVSSTAMSVALLLRSITLFSICCNGRQEYNGIGVG